MKKYFAPIEICEYAISKGMKAPCFGAYQTQEGNRLITYSFNDLTGITHLVQAFLYVQIIDWLREEKKVVIFPYYNTFDSEPYYMFYSIEYKRLFISIDEAIKYGIFW